MLGANLGPEKSALASEIIGQIKHLTTSSLIKELEKCSAFENASDDTGMLAERNRAGSRNCEVDSAVRLLA